jgi:hypothetical protein
MTGRYLELAVVACRFRVRRPGSRRVNGRE